MQPSHPSKKLTAARPTCYPPAYSPIQRVHPCLSCKAAKVKCDYVQPCSRCTRRNLECNYAENKDGRIRKYHRRSTKGCLCCKSRHVRCDEVRPKCSNCLVRGDECKYPEPVPGSSTAKSRTRSLSPHRQSAAGANDDRTSSNAARKQPSPSNNKTTDKTRDQSTIHNIDGSTHGHHVHTTRGAFDSALGSGLVNKSSMLPLGHHDALSPLDIDLLPTTVDPTTHSYPPSYSDLPSTAMPLHLSHDTIPPKWTMQKGPPAPAAPSTMPMNPVYTNNRSDEPWFHHPDKSDFGPAPPLPMENILPATEVDEADAREMELFKQQLQASDYGSRFMDPQFTPQPFASTSRLQPQQQQPPQPQPQQQQMDTLAYLPGASNDSRFVLLPDGDGTESNAQTTQTGNVLPTTNGLVPQPLHISPDHTTYHSQLPRGDPPMPHPLYANSAAAIAQSMSNDGGGFGGGSNTAGPRRTDFDPAFIRHIWATMNNPYLGRPRFSRAYDPGSLETYFPNTEQRFQFKHFTTQTCNIILTIPKPLAQNPWLTHFVPLALAYPYGASLTCDAFRLGILSLAAFDIGFRMSRSPVLSSYNDGEGDLELNANGSEREQLRGNAMYQLSVVQRAKALELLNVAKAAGELDASRAGTLEMDLALGTALILAIRDVSCPFFA